MTNSNAILHCNEKKFNPIWPGKCTIWKIPVVSNHCFQLKDTMQVGQSVPKISTDEITFETIKSQYHLIPETGELS